MPQTIDDLLLYRLSRLLSVAGSMVIRLCEGRFGITRREWRLIATLANHEHLTSSQLADHAQLDRARTSKAVSSLAAKQLILRTHPAGNRRQVMLHLTPQGRAVHEALFPLVTGINAELMAALDDAQAAALDEGLHRLQARAESMVAGAKLPRADRRRNRPTVPPGSTAPG